MRTADHGDPCAEETTDRAGTSPSPRPTSSPAHSWPAGWTSRAGMQEGPGPRSALAWAGTAGGPRRSSRAYAASAPAVEREQLGGDPHGPSRGQLGGVYPMRPGVCCRLTNALRLSAAALALTTLLAAAAALGSCSGPGVAGWACYYPAPGETGADGGPDPCHCDPPPGQPPACECLSTPEGTQEYNACNEENGQCKKKC
jgi:hypothetical protein